MRVEVPKKLKERYAEIVDDMDAFLEFLTKPLQKSFRVNALKASVKEVRERFRSYGIEMNPVPWYSEAFVTEEGAGLTLEHFLGKIYMQELTSMIPPLAVRKELSSARLVLDACAAPGSKTTQLSAIMKNRGTVVANDIDYNRLRALKFNVEKTGALNVVMTNHDARFFQGSGYDVVLADVPCSAEGTIRKNTAMLSHWSEKNYAKYSSIQKQIAKRCFEVLAPGGVLVYSTCTIAPEENEAVVSWLLERTDAKILSFSLKGLKYEKGVREWKGREFHPEVRKCMRIWPHHNDTGGFFIAKVMKE